MRSETATVIYLPVLHQGYLDFFSRQCLKSDSLFILGNSVIRELTSRPEIRALDPFTAAKVAYALNFFSHVAVLEKSDVRQLSSFNTIISACDAVSRGFVKKYAGSKRIIYDTAFLQWDKSNVLTDSDVKYDRISDNPYDQMLMDSAFHEAKKSSCWWRQVGAVLVHGKNSDNQGMLFRAHNQHLPTEHEPYLNGDPRDFITAGEKSEYASSIHAEALIISLAAQKGISLSGSHLYVTVFPCPQCAKMVAFSGISKLFYANGHANLNGEAVLRDKGVEIIWVK